MYTIRKAQANDAAAIRRLIWKVKINPLGLDWRHFLVAVDEHAQVIATGQIKPHRDHTRELASIATQPEWRGQGIASAIIRQLLAETPRPLYLTTIERTAPFYLRFGFQRLTLAEMPPELGRNARLVDWLRRRVFQGMPVMVVMKIG
jgi:N-acetylglutamate synthase-like GNAT family acetyltransferase